LPPPDWLIDNILTVNGLSVLWGRSGDMKSFVALDMGLCVAAGVPWHGTETKPGLVLYVAAEGSYGLARRAVGWRRTRGRELSKPQFKIIPHNIALATADLDQLVQQIQQLETKPNLIIIDTLARTFGAGDENKQADMNAYVSAADRLRELTGAHVMIVHHTGVHADKRERGSNVLRGAADTMIKVQRNGDRLAIINRAPEGKQKDAEEFKTINLRAQKVAYLANGTEQTTLILNLDEEPPTATTETHPKPLGRVEDAILKAMKKAKEPLGFNRLKLMTDENQGSISRALRTLEERGMVSEVENQGGSARLWRLA
jgi:RecA-family ATPase